MCAVRYASIWKKENHCSATRHGARGEDSNVRGGGNGGAGAAHLVVGEYIHTYVVHPSCWEWARILDGRLASWRAAPVCVCVVLNHPARIVPYVSRNRPDQTDWIFRILIDKINAEKVQNQTSKNKVRKRPAQKSAPLRFTCCFKTYRSWEISGVPSSPSAVFPFELAPFDDVVEEEEEELVCMRKLAVSTN